MIYVYGWRNLKIKYNNCDIEFYEQIANGKRLTTVEVIYRMPDYLSILQEFIWQTMDNAPDYPRISRFLEYWELNIDAPIYKVSIINNENIISSPIKNITKQFKI